MSEKRDFQTNPATNGYEKVNTEPIPSNQSETDDRLEKSDTRGDRMNIVLLLILYFLQGIPLGLCGTIPILLQNRGANYQQLAKFSFVFYPFSMKLLWAPIVDAVFWSRVGRRKSWLVPAQYVIGIFLLIASTQVNDWLGNVNQHIEPNIPMLTAIFFGMTFLAATQGYIAMDELAVSNNSYTALSFFMPGNARRVIELTNNAASDIAVDGWALTMLKKRNVGYASTCNSIGQSTGSFVGYTVLIALESSKFCNEYLRSTPAEEGLITLPGFMKFWGTCFLITTTLVAFFKSEQNKSKEDEKDSENELGIVDTYKLLFRIIKLRPVQILMLLLLTVTLIFAPSDALTNLKMIEAGISKETIALLAIPMIPLQVILQIIVSKPTAGPKPISIYIKALIFRILFDMTSAGIVAIVPYFTDANGQISFYLYAMFIINSIIHAGLMNCMFIARVSFFAKISDPLIGGTYMTMLATVSNLGFAWTSSLALWMVDVLTWKQCKIPMSNNEFPFANVTASNPPDISSIMDNTCRKESDQDECRNFGGKCVTTIDGFYVESLICFIYGIVWFKWGTSQFRFLQSLPRKAWRVAEEEQQMQPLKEV